MRLYLAQAEEALKGRRRPGHAPKDVVSPVRATLYASSLQRKYS